MKDPKVLLSEEVISQRVDELGQKITQDYQGEEIVILCILKGAFIFASDLIRSIDLPLSVEFMTLSSYGDQTESSGEVKVVSDLPFYLTNKNILIVEDIVDTGLTINTLMQKLQDHHPKSVKLASFLVKPEKIFHPVQIDYTGFEIEDKFVVGYGLDYAQKYRNLSFVGYFES